MYQKTVYLKRVILIIAIVIAGFMLYSLYPTIVNNLKYHNEKILNKNIKNNNNFSRFSIIHTERIILAEGSGFKDISILEDKNNSNNNYLIVEDIMNGAITITTIQKEKVDNIK
jgi:hypothetical protein